MDLNADRDVTFEQVLTTVCDQLRNGLNNRFLGLNYSPLIIHLPVLKQLVGCIPFCGVESRIKKTVKKLSDTDRRTAVLA